MNYVLLTKNLCIVQTFETLEEAILYCNQNWLDKDEYFIEEYVESLHSEDSFDRLGY